MSQNATLEQFSFWEFKGEVDYVDKWFLMSTPIPVLTIWLAYLAFVLKFGPDLMKKRAPYDLKNVLILYNILQIIISFMVFCVEFNLLLQNGLICERNCLSDNKDLEEYTAIGIHYYLLAKLTELLDTIFFVLRKKNEQITFLHVYHHSSAMLCTWFILKYEPSYSTIFLGAINSFTHIIMYAYYGLSAFPDLTKYLWWKKYITTIQLVQFLLITLQAVINYNLSPCRPTYYALSVIILNTIFFIYLFGDFYIRSYIREHGNGSDDRAAENNIMKGNNYECKNKND